MENILHINHEESSTQLNMADPALLGVPEHAVTYANALTRQKRTIDVFAASERSPESSKLDQLRDKAYSALKAYLKVYANDPDNTLSEAAERLLFVVRKSAIDAGDTLRLGLAKATTAINSLLRNLEPLRADIELIGASQRFNALETANRSFEELQIERNLEKAGKHPGSVKDARAVTDAAGLRIIDSDGNTLTTGAPKVSELPGNVLRVTFSGNAGQKFSLTFYEDRFELTGSDRGWALELKTAPNAELPFLSVEENHISATYNGFKYSVVCPQGSFVKTEGCAFRILSDKGKITVDCSKRM